MLPRATHERTRREVTSGKPSGRTQEIQRLIGRSLRAVVDLAALGERQITIDCDVLQADGGTRTAAITGAWVALHDCLAMDARPLDGHRQPAEGPCRRHLLRHRRRAVRCSTSTTLEDSGAETDANFVMTGSGGLVEVQGTAEGKPFSEEELMACCALRARAPPGSSSCRSSR